MLKTFVAKDLAVTFTAKKEVMGKKVFKNTKLFDCMNGEYFY